MKLLFAPAKWRGMPVHATAKKAETVTSGPERVLGIPLRRCASQGCVATLPPAVQAPLSRTRRAVVGMHSGDRSAGR